MVESTEIEKQKSSHDPHPLGSADRGSKKSGQWFAGGVTDENSRTLDVPMNFLDPGKTYVTMC